MTCNITPSLIDAVLGILTLNIQYGWQETELANGNTQFTVYGENLEILSKLENLIKSLDPAIQTILEEIDLQNPLDAWKEFFTPVECGSKFVVLPPWLKNDIFGQRIKIIINPKSAFGTGHHASTELCLTILSRLVETNSLNSGQNFLDLGCGSGILGIAAAKLGLEGIGVDIDQVAIDNARENRQLNNVKNLRFMQGSLDVTQGKKFDLIMANILAGPLIEMALQICAQIQKNGILILSGILNTQAANVDQAYQKCGLPGAQKFELGEWAALLWNNVIF